MKKLRQDSVAANLPPYLKDAVDEMLFSGAAYKAVQERVAEDGITWSLTSIAQYYHNHVQPLLATRRKDVAAKLNKMDASDLDEATLQAVRSTVFDLATSPGSDPQTLKTLFGIVQSYAKGKLESTRLQLDIDKWQTMAAQALLDKALSPEVQAIVNGEGSDAQKVAMLRPLLFGKEQSITPEFVNG
ncbi:DUF3486 family protein [Akkermansia sp. Marseille-P9185]|uniref:phage protein Gp27 family protein n=1 Tax=Akkermansia massiliensis TaxID=2927224 RepID=UPI00209BDFC6|nr:phage protein Gp27 family protein [Akkermansia massiliensis]MCO8185533.1 DUF3486 family protein [Akkermansia massiliensis]